MNNNKSKKVLFVATVVKSHINVFHLPYLKWFKDKGYETHVCARDDFDGEECIIPNCDVHYDILFERSPISTKNFSAYKQLKKIIKDNEYDIIHCNTPVASILTRLAAIKARKKGTKVIYTAHGFHFFKGAPIFNWILYYPVEKICSYFTDVLITINKEDYELAKRKMKAKKIEYVPGVGVDTEKFKQLSIDIDKKREKLGLSKDDIVLLSVGELNKNKNHEVIIRALAKLNNPNVKYIIAGRGKLESYLNELAKELNVEKQLKLLGFRNDVTELYGIANIFCFPSYREGLSLSLMEAMASGLPCVVSNIRGNTDLIKNNKCLVEVESIDSYKKNLNRLIDDRSLYKEVQLENIKIIEQYDKKIVKKYMERIYTFEISRFINGDEKYVLN